MRPNISYSNYEGWGKLYKLSFWFLGVTFDWGYRRWVAGFERVK